MIVSAVPTEHVAHAWKAAGPLLDGAVEYAEDRFDSFSLFQKCVNGEYRLWIAFEDDIEEIVAAFTTQIVEYPKRKALAIHWVGGKPGTLHQWYGPVCEVLERVGKELGCDHLEAHGREEWVGQHTRHGWKKKYVTCEKELTDGWR